MASASVTTPSLMFRQRPFDVGTDYACTGCEDAKKICVKNIATGKKIYHTFLQDIISLRLITSPDEKFRFLLLAFINQEEAFPIFLN